MGLVWVQMGGETMLTHVCLAHKLLPELDPAHIHPSTWAVFSFLYLKKNSKIYVRFEIFQKYTPVALP